ncbi:aminoglycoside phosphotransferase family protein [Streptomyces sp. Q6]|uniref:Aminoglycoside phosphotransferase family protein n=1 Tax=Streptomyces citrinus TaxID=3118173 RepID=A0ACD5AM23_9ACTN
MAVRKLHQDEADIDEGLVRRLVDDAFPRWAGRPLRYVDSHGTQNVLFRLGDEHVIRLPRIRGAVSDLARELRWMPVLARRLPVPVPEPVAEGRPAHGFPGRGPCTAGCPARSRSWGAEAAGGARRGPGGVRRGGQEHRPGRGARGLPGPPLTERDADTRAVLGRLADVIDADGALAVWDAAVRAPRGPEPAVWLHGDLQPGNVLVDGGRLSAVIDFGCMGLGDPAVDLIAAWYVLDARGRETFRTALAPDADTWARGRGWALTIAAHELDYYRTSNPFMAETATRVIGELVISAPRASA